VENMQQEEKKTTSFPLLSNFLNEEQTLRPLRYLPAAIEFQTLLLKRFNRALDRETALNMTIKDVLKTAPNKQKWREAFEGFKNAWNLGWRFVERFGCLELPKAYKGIVMDESISINFCMPQEKNQGICALALTNYLCTRHNQFVELVYERLLLRGGNMQRIEDRKSVVTTNFFSTAHALSYSLQDKFSPYVAKNCVTFTDDGRIVYDFENAEQYLLDVFFTGKPLVKQMVRMVQYRDDEGAVNTHLFRQKVTQVALSREEQKKILSELGSPAAANKCMRLLETCISFLQATGGSLVQKLDVADLKISDYVKDVLLMDDVIFGSETVKRNMKLKHIDGLFKILRGYTVADVFEAVRPKYKDSLDQKATSIVKDSLRKLNLEVLLPAMQEAIIQYLSEGNMSADGPIHEFLGYMEHDDVYFNDMSWFQHFPKMLLMKNICDVYKVFEDNYSAT